MLLAEIAKQENWNLKIVSNGKELIIELDQGHYYDIVLMDIQMPIMNGIDTTTFIRSNSKYDHLPIIAMSAFAMNENIDLAMASGINGYITKPFSIKHFKEVVYTNCRLL